MRNSDNIRYFGELLVAIPDDKEKEIIAISRAFEKEAKREVKYVDSSMLSEIGVACTTGALGTGSVDEFRLDVGYRMDFRYAVYYQGKLDGLTDADILAGGTFTEEDIIFYEQISELLGKMYSIYLEIRG